MIGRRRSLAIVAGALLGSGVRLPVPAASRTLRWDGSVLGAAASITLYHPDERAGRRLIDASLDEIDRLESIFSLYRPDSELCRLNAEGNLANPSLDMQHLMAASLRVARMSEGAFDPTIQPLYRLYAEHFRAHPDDESGPDRPRIEAARALVDWRAVELAPGRIAFSRAGMQVTFNGIARGYILDGVADLLRAAGMGNVLLGLDEHLALGGRPDGTPFRVMIRDPATATGRIVPLLERAMSSSGGYGTVFDRLGRFHHLIDPGTGDSPNWFRSVTVIAPSGTLADALSTAASVLPPEDARRLLRRAGVRGFFLGFDGAVSETG